MEAAPPDGGVGRVWFCVPFGEGGMSNCGSTLSFLPPGITMAQSHLIQICTACFIQAVSKQHALGRFKHNIAYESLVVLRIKPLAVSFFLHSCGLQFFKPHSLA